MQKTRLKKILNAAYELEALLELALRRNPAPEEMDSLIAEKADTIRRLVSDKEPEAIIEEENVAEIMTAADQEPEPEPDQEAEIPAAEKAVAGPKRDLKRLFSLNDRFRYARELFGGDRRKFDEALEEASRIDEKKRIREFFLGKFGWDADNETAAEFLAKAEGGEPR